MPRGGARTGKIGNVYSNRTDLNAPKVPTLVPKGMEYGQRQALEASQRAVPMGPGQPGQAAPIGSQAPPGGPQGAPVGQAPPPMPPAPMASFTRPTERPNEPLTHGLPIGPGGGPEVLGQPAQRTDPITLQLRALYQRFPSQELADLISEQ